MVKIPGPGHGHHSENERLGYVLEDNILRIATISDLTKESEEQLRSKEAKKKAEDLVTRVVSINYTVAKNLEPTLKNPCRPRRDRGGRTDQHIIIKDIARNMDEVISLIKVLDKTFLRLLSRQRSWKQRSTSAASLAYSGESIIKQAQAQASYGETIPSSIGVTGAPGRGRSSGGNTW